MDAIGLFLHAHARLHASDVAAAERGIHTVDLALRGVHEEAQFRLRPLPDLNSLAWVLWHVARWEDIAVNVLFGGRPQVLDEGAWCDRLGIDRRDAGVGMDAVEVSAFNERIQVNALLAYRSAVGRRTREIVAGWDASFLDQPVDSDRFTSAMNQGMLASDRALWVIPGLRDGTNAFILDHVALVHTSIHLGELSVIKSLLSGTGVR